jgi:hypothetical protein
MSPLAGPSALEWPIDCFRASSCHAARADETTPTIWNCGRSFASAVLTDDIPNPGFPGAGQPLTLKQVESKCTSLLTLAVN